VGDSVVAGGTYTHCNFNCINFDEMNWKKQYYGKHCSYCGRPLSSVSFSREHVVPTSRGGSNKKSNKIACCKTCNQQKGAMTLDEYINWLERFKPENWSIKVLLCTSLLANHS
jgi:5-methylcytosine-specific restriction endonuclease McrA